jgi:hypothetical protein
METITSMQLTAKNVNNFADYSNEDDYKGFISCIALIGHYYMKNKEYKCQDYLNKLRKHFINL